MGETTLNSIGGIRIWHVALFNLLGILVSVSYGVMGRSGGETTEGAWTILFVTGAFSVVLVVLCMINAICQKRVIWYEPALALLILAVNAMELYLLQEFWQWVGL